MTNEYYYGPWRDHLEESRKADGYFITVKKTPEGSAPWLIRRAWME